ncbi:MULTISPECIES: YeiH family protein [unclassified Paenibacillus]|uniref:YeiH family protein n=1 Tax=unclassified Paenibacillus TaxID=185978 RepID=UPI0024072449|nr:MULTISPECIES: YeiH family protein [unclassified Paenibacillus]MDF9852340.1 putative integral membrane protein (TIGR00698 family) [Paenibacillus sp. PastF-1]MDH6505668.1 putative integral membrane protein (TIGR00698 family) [Paenibacillus sp. PastM-3]
MHIHLLQQLSKLEQGKKQGWKTAGFRGFAEGLLLTLALAAGAKYLAMLPLLGVMGQLVLAILLGIILRAAAGVPERAAPGIQFSSKKLLRAGIILLGLRLNINDIIQAGPKVLAIAVIHIVFTLITVYLLGRAMNIDRRLGILTACGTAICGAAAVAAVAPQIKADDNEIAVSAATVAVLGTIFTLVYIAAYPLLGLSEAGYGIFAGATLHEVAHVLAASAPVGQQAADLAVIVKLTRVALLAPVALGLGLWENRRLRKQSAAEYRKDIQSSDAKNTRRNFPVPWFIGGFLVMSGVNTLGFLPDKLTADLLVLAYLLLAMAMAGLGLGIDLTTFGRLGRKPFAAGLAGSLLLSLLGYVLIHVMGLK